MAKLLLKNIVKRFEHQMVINHLDLEIQSGEFAVIVGPSGCGKSTLLRLIAGLEDVTEGDIIIDDKLVNRVEPKDRNIAMVFQHYALYPHMSVYDNMAYGLKIAGFTKSEIFSRVARTSVTLQLDKVLDRKPHELSGGQRQRVAMGRAIVREPAIFLFDEPLSNLDNQLKVQMRHEIRKLQKETHATHIYVTHDQVEAMTLADKIIVMNKGSIQQVGTPHEIYTRPANKFVASFFGLPSMNFFKGSYDASSQTLKAGDGLHLNMQLGVELLGGAETLLVGIRPDNFRINPENPTFKMKVDFVETLGRESYLYGRLAKTGEAIIFKDERTKANTGDVIPLSLSANELHLYRDKDGFRIN